MMTRLALGARGETTCCTETGEAPAWQGATRAPLGHRRPRSNAAHAGCGAGRRQQGFRHGLLGLLGCLGAACGAPEPAAPPAETAAPDAGAGTILRVDPRFDALVPADARIEKLAEGYVFTEGPVWDRRESRLLFSDVRGNGVYQWSEADGTRPVIEPVFEGDRTGLRSVSSNGLTPRRRGPSRPVRARQPAHLARGGGRHPDHPGGQLRGPPAEQPERRRLRVERLALLHRPGLGARGARRVAASGSSTSTASTG